MKPKFTTLLLLWLVAFGPLSLFGFPKMFSDILTQESVTGSQYFQAVQMGTFALLFIHVGATFLWNGRTNSWSDYAPGQVAKVLARVMVCDGQSDTLIVCHPVNKPRRISVICFEDGLHGSIQPGTCFVIYKKTSDYSEVESKAGVKLLLVDDLNKKFSLERSSEFRPNSVAMTAKAEC